MVEDKERNTKKKKKKRREKIWKEARWKGWKRHCWIEGNKMKWAPLLLGLCSDYAMKVAESATGSGIG